MVRFGGTAHRRSRARVPLAKLADARRGTAGGARAGSSERISRTGSKVVSEAAQRLGLEHRLARHPRLDPLGAQPQSRLRAGGRQGSASRAVARSGSS
jgi:hypothetical protein